MRKPIRPLAALAVALLLAAHPATQAAAQEAPTITRLAVPQGESAVAYERANAWHLGRTELFYIDRLEGEIPMDGAPPFRPPPPQSAPEIDIGWTAALALLIAALGYLLYKFGGPAAGLIAAQPGDARMPQTAEVGPDRTEPADLAALRTMADRAHALRMLTDGSLARAAEANALRRSKSETARETLAKIPPAWAHRAALKQIVLAQELTAFGGRPLSPEGYERCFAAAAPIWAGGR